MRYCLKQPFQLQPWSKSTPGTTAENLHHLAHEPPTTQEKKERNLTWKALEPAVNAIASALVLGQVRGVQGFLVSMRKKGCSMEAASCLFLKDSQYEHGRVHRTNC